MAPQEVKDAEETMYFEMRHKVFTDAAPEAFSMQDAPDWLTGADSTPGSTMDKRWFWKKHVLTLQIGESVETDFRVITRVAASPVGAEPSQGSKHSVKRRGPSGMGM